MGIKKNIQNRYLHLHDQLRIKNSFGFPTGRVFKKNSVNRWKPIGHEMLRK